MSTSAGDFARAHARGRGAETAEGRPRCRFADGFGRRRYLRRLLFQSFPYLLLLAATALARWFAPRPVRRGALLLASGVFYASWGVRPMLVLLGVALASYAAGLAIERWRSHARLLLVAALVFLLGALGLFKYTGFLIEQLRALGLLSPGAPVSIAAPLGISFYTFTAVATVIDVFRGEPAERSLSVHLVHVTFFPHLAAGPIVRKRELADRVHRGLDEPFDPDRFSMGLLLIALGLFKKMVLADGLAAQATSAITRPHYLSSAGVALGVIAYAGQILCDFSGYSDVAIGSAKVLGIDSPANFDLPYLSASPAEFWRRWHMSLSRWLRDYLWVAVGGTRREAVFRIVAPIVTMTLAGLWHGAAWTFVAWGLYHGLLLSVHQLWARFGARFAFFHGRVRPSVPYRAVATVLTFGLVCLGWILFAAPSIGGAWVVLQRLAAGAPGRLGAASTRTIELLTVLAVGHVVGAGGWALDAYRGAPGPVKGLAWLTLLACLYCMAAPPTEFIYFTF